MGYRIKNRKVYITMKEFEKIKQKIKEVNTKADSKRAELMQQIEKAQLDMQRAKEAEETAALESKVEDFQLHQATQAMLTKQLEKLHEELKSIDYAPLTSTEHTAIITELRKVAKDAVLSKYQKLIDLLDAGETVVQDIDNIIKEYYTIFMSLDDLVYEHETDFDGVPYKKFLFSDICKVDTRITNTFCNVPHSIKCFLKAKIKNRSI